MEGQMQPNWAEILQAISSGGTLLVAIAGITFVVWQIRQVDRSVRSNTHERLTNESLDILRFLADHPSTYDYFYGGKPIPAQDDNTLKYATEMIANYLEHVVMQMETLPTEMQKTWRSFVRDQYARSPIIRDHLFRFREWYSPKLLKMVEDVKVIAPETNGVQKSALIAEP
jgi:hypothetical protein